MRRRVLCALLALTLLLAMLPSVVGAEGETIKEVSNETDLRAALTNEAYSTVKMIADININSQIQTNRSVTLNLNGHVLRQTVKNEQVIRVDSGTTLTLKDSQPDAPHDGLPAGGVITGSDVSSQNMDGGAVFVSSGCTFIMDGGSIVGCRAANGGGVYLWENASFIMNGGSIVQCWAKSSGGGVYVSSGATFIMNDGTISDCSTDPWIGDGKNVTNLGTFIDNTKCTVIFDSDAGSTVDSQVVQKRGKVKEPDDPMKHGYTFDDWYVGDSDTKWNFEEGTVTGPMTLKAKWTIKQYTVTFDPDGGSDVAAITQDYNTAVDAPEAPTKYGYTFAGWYDGEAKQEFPFTLTDNKTLKAKWTLIPVTPAEEPTTPWWNILPALDQTADFPFYDVDSNDWFYEAVKSAWENELIDGVTARYFKPDNTLTVAQAIKLAAALHQKQSVGFVTLQNGGTHWYDNYVNYAVTNGLIEAAYQSKSAETMNEAVTRADFVHILAKLLNASTINTVNSIPDVKSGDAYADEIFAFYRAGILTGSDRLGTFHPESSLKRSEAAAILVRLYDATQRQYITLR